jgi:uncharacterized protein
MRDDAEGAAAWRAAPDALAVRVRVTPRGGRDAFDGLDTLADGRAVLKIRVRAAPEDGAANEAVRRTLAQALGRPVSAVRLTAGATARIKTLVVAGEGGRLAAALERLTRGAAA